MYESSGNSLKDAGVHSGYRCTYHPIDRSWICPKGSGLDSDLKVGDIVFCEVQAKWATYATPMRKNVFYAHMVNRIGFDDTSHRYYYVISGAKGFPGTIEAHENGWCYIEHIYGKLTETGPTADTMRMYNSGYYEDVNRREYIR